MKNSTFSAQVANNLLTLLQGYSKTIRLLLVMLLTLTVTTNAWGADYSATHTSNVSFTAGTNGSSAKVIINGTEYEAMKLGTSSKVGTMTFTIPVGTTKIHLHVAGWKGKNTKFNISAGNGVTLATTSITSTADAGINNSSPFTISSTSNVTSNYYKVIDINSGATTSETTITITTTSTGYRAVIWGVNAETSTPGGGGSTPTQLSAPTGLTESNITSSGATLSWNAVANASNYSVTINGNTETVTTNSYSATGLTAGTEYTWSVVAKGDGTNYTDSEAAQHTFTTKTASTPGTGGESSTATFTYTDLKGQGASGSGANFTGATKENIHMSGKGNGNNSYVQIYANNYLTFTPTNATITKIVLTATSGYIKTWSASEGTIEVSGDKATWTGNSTSMVTLTNTASAQARITQMDVTYTASGGDDPEPVIVKTLKSIEVTGMTTTFEQGDVFKFDGTCTATYSVTKDGAAQADETAEVTPTSVSEPDMSTAGTKEVTVTYTEGEITKTFPYNITVENTLPKIVITQNEVAEFTNTYAEYTWTASGVSGKIYGYKNSGMQLNSSKDGSYVYNTDPIPGYIRKIKIVKAASGTTRNWTPYVSETALTSAEGTGLTQKEVATTTTWEVTGENSYFYLLESGGATVIESITIYYEAVVPQVAAPTFTPAAGTYNAVQNVTISAEAGTTIYYTLDGTGPTTTSEVYNTPITVSETQTIKAIAVKDEKVSPVATATYTINLPLTTMDQIFAKATAVGSTPTSVEITFGNWVVSAVKEDGKTAFVTDGTKGFVIYEASCGFKVGDILSGTAACKVLLYNGFAELTGLKSTTTGLSVATGGEINVVELDEDGIAALTGVNTGSLIKINGICSSSDSKYYVADVQIYTSLYNFGTLEVGAEYNITGIYQPYNSTKEILPRSAADIEKVVGLPTATIAIADITMEIGQEKTIEATITPDAAQTKVQYAITAGSEYIDLDGTTITAVAAGTATITATIAEKADEYKGATKEFTVTVKPQNIAVLPFTFNDGKEDIENTLGMSQTGLDDDYGSAPKLKFNGAGDNVIVHFDSQAGEFSFLLKQNGSNAGTFTVYESANGEDYTSVWSGGDLGGNGKSATIEPTLSATARYVKFEYTTKGNSTNYALGSISIAKPDNCQVTITYYGFGGGYTTDCETDPVIVITKGDTYQIPNCEPTDYDNTLNRTFAGTWVDDKGNSYKPGDSFEVIDDITLYAQWALNTSENTTLPTDVEDLATTDIVVTGGTTLTLKAGTTTINSLTLKGGIQADGSYKMPIINIPDNATLKRKSDIIYLDLVVNAKNYYPFAVPFRAKNGSDKANWDYVGYIDPDLKDAAKYRTHFVIKTYDGAKRAENGENRDANWVIVNQDTYLEPGIGYMITAMTAGKDTATIRIPMSVPNEWLADGEQESITVKEQTTTRNQVAVTAYTGKASDSNNGGHQRHAGWNFVANPYLSNFTGGTNSSNVEGSFINGEITINNGEYSYGGENVPYVTIPTYDFAHYDQVRLSEATLSPAYSFFVQVGESGTMTFKTAGRQQAPASIAARNAEERPVKMDVDITLSDNHSSDQTGIIISDRYSDAYEIGRDLEKLFGSAYNLSVYTLMADNTPLAFQALAIRSNMQVIPVGYRAPEQGEYTFRLNEATSSIDLLNEQYEQLVLVDYQTGELTNLLIADYTFYSERTQADNRFAIYAVPRQNAPTDLPNAIGQDKQAQKIIHNGHLYILRDGNVYNGNGQIVK